jgi:hypothetical protein
MSKQAGDVPGKTTTKRVVRAFLYRCALSACYALGVFLLLPFDGGGETGWLTGPLITLLDYGCLLFLIAALLALFVSRWAGFVGLAAAALCWPWWLYVINPNVYKPIFWLYRSVDGRIEWSKSSPPPFSYYTLVHWMEALFFLFITILSFRAVKAAMPRA